jgi:hypothetical protein
MKGLEWVNIYEGYKLNEDCVSRCGGRHRGISLRNGAVG